MLNAELQLGSPMESTPDPQDDQSIEAQQARAAVKQWQSRILNAKAKWEPDFKRMRQNMEFVSGLQWSGQTTIDDERYINNLTLRLINQKVATLYAKNPTAAATPRERLDFELWDGEVDSLMDSIQQATEMVQTGQPLPPELSALFADFQQGKDRQKLVQKVCDTVRLTYQYQVDCHKPDFKEQMKALVRRTIVTGVGYCKLNFCRDEPEYTKLSTIDTKSEVSDRMSRIRGLLAANEDMEFDEDSPQFETLRSLVMSVGASSTLQDDTVMSERLEFDFPPATSIIVDPRCRGLKDFIAARWVAQEYVLPVDEINAVFGTNIKAGTSADSSAVEKRLNKEMANGETSLKDDPFMKKPVSLFEVYDYTTKTKFYICEGWKEYVSAPEPVTPGVAGFWPIFALVFNDVEVEADGKTSLFPPSDVQLVKSPQKEWNRTREALRDHRNANAPGWWCRKGLISANDRDALQNAVPNSVTELEGVPPDMDLSKFLIAKPFIQIDERDYDTAPLEQDLMLSAGAQQANIGPAQPNVTATVGTIAEQSRLDVVSSNVDDLDGFLSRLAQAGGEMLLQEMQRDTVRRIVGIGAVWPDMPESRQDFKNEVFLTIQAASSGRPNKAIDIANFQQLAPLMLQAGANPVGIVQEAAKRMDDNIDISKFFPLIPTVSASPSQEANSPEGSTESQPPVGNAPASGQPQEAGPLVPPPNPASTGGF